jgi:hypothetical protein
MLESTTVLFLFTVLKVICVADLGELC